MIVCHQFYILLFDCLPPLIKFMSVDSLFINALPLAIGKKLTAPLYSGTTKHFFFLRKKSYKKWKLSKRCHGCKGYASHYDVEILNFLDPELQFENTESAIENKLKDLLSESRDFKFVTTLVIEFKKVTIQKNVAHFILTQEQKQLLWKATLIVYLNNLYCDYIKHSKISWKRFGLDY